MFQPVIPLLTRPKRSPPRPISRGSVWPRDRHSENCRQTGDGRFASGLPGKLRFAEGCDGADKIELASELGFKDSFPDCDVGAMPPFGNLYRLEVYAAESLAKNEEIMFNAGTHSEIIKLAYKDFENLAKPKVANFSYSVSL